MLRGYGPSTRSKGKVTLQRRAGAPEAFPVCGCAVQWRLVPLFSVKSYKSGRILNTLTLRGWHFLEVAYVDVIHSDRLPLWRQF